MKSNQTVLCAAVMIAVFVGIAVVALFSSTLEAEQANAGFPIVGSYVYMGQDNVPYLVVRYLDAENVLHEAATRLTVP